MVKTFLFNVIALLDQWNKREAEENNAFSTVKNWHKQLIELLVGSCCNNDKNKAALAFVTSVHQELKNGCLDSGSLDQIILEYPLSFLSDEKEESVLRLNRLDDLVETRQKQGNKKYNDIMLLETSRYIDSLALFAFAADHLDEGGRLMIADFFSLKRVSAAYCDPFHYLRFITNQAEHFGFQRATKNDFSPDFKNYLHDLLASLDRWRQRLIETLNLHCHQIDEFKRKITVICNRIDQQEQGYFFLQYHYQPTAENRKWRPVSIDSRHENEMVALFADVFKTPMTLEERRWKYDNDRGVGIGVRSEGKLVGFFGGLSRQIQYYGTPRFALQVCDFMVALAGRESLFRKGPVFLLMSTIIEQHVGYGARYLFVYAAPNLRASNVQKKYKIGDDVNLSVLVEIEWQAGGAISLYSKVREISLADANIRKLIDQLWLDMTKDFTDCIIGNRDADYLDYRYRQIPGRTYRAFMISNRFDQIPLALIILADRAENGYELVDLVARKKNFAIAIKQARRIVAHIGGKPRLYCWTARAFAGLFSPEKTTELKIEIPRSIWSDGPDATDLHEKFLLMGGDIDFR